HVFVGCDPAAALHRLVDDGNCAPVRQLYLEREGLSLLERQAQIGVITPRIERERSGGDACIEQIADRAALPDVTRIDAVHLAVALVPDLEAVLCIEHAQPL